MNNYFIDTRLLAIQSLVRTKNLKQYQYNIVLYRCVKKMRNMNHFFDKPQKETHLLLTELENRLN